MQTNKSNTTKGRADNNVTKTHEQLSKPDPGEAPSQALEVVLTPASIVAADAPEGWALRINRNLERGVESLVEAGRLLLAAKAALRRGQWEDLFGLRQLRIDKRTAEMLMRIAKNPVLADPHNYSVLPPTLNALYLLSGVTESRLGKAMKANKISPTMTIKETKQLVSKLEPAKTKLDVSTVPSATTVEKTVYGERDLHDGLTRIAAVLSAEFDRCPDQAWKDRLADKISEYLKHHSSPAAVEQQARN